MSQRKALIASVVITLVLALTAIGIRAAFVDSPNTSAGQDAGVTLVVPGSNEDGDEYNDDEYDDATSTTNTTWDDESDDDEHEEEHEDEEDHDDDEH